MPRVCITKVKNKNVYDAVNTCFNEIVTDSLLKGVEKVLIKPNFLNSSPANSGVTTDLRIIEGLVQILKKRGIKRIYIGESSLGNTEKVFARLNVFELEKIGAEVVNFDDDQWLKVDSPTSMVLGKFHLAKTVLESDLIISAAKMKTHDETAVTLSMKNILGMIPKRDRWKAHIRGINKAIVDVFSYLVRNKKFISFVDAIYALEGKLGPIRGDPIKMDLIIAGDDAVSTDKVCTEIMGYDANMVEHILLSGELGLGDLENIKTIGENIENVKRKFEMPPSIPPLKSRLLSSSANLLLSSLSNKLFKKKPYLGFEERCVLCGTCVENCPMEAINMNKGKINIDYKKCINCLICIESCEEAALDYEITNPSIYRAIKRLKLGNG